MTQFHVIGAGLAGLAAALSLTRAGRKVTVHEAGPAAGGRCRSYLDRELGIRVDNGNHLLLSGNDSAFGYIDEIGARAAFKSPSRPLFPFIDLQTGERWTLRPSRGRIPWWILLPGRRIPNTRLLDYLDLVRIARVTDDSVVADMGRRGRLYWRLTEPLAVAALNTQPQKALARLLGAVLRETLMQGGRACIPAFPHAGLSEALVDPALEVLAKRGAEVRFGARITRLTIEQDRVTALHAGTERIEIGPQDGVVMAVPAWVAADLLPGLPVPTEHEAIVNIHYRTDYTPAGPIAEAGFVGVVEGTAEWVFAKPDHVSVTISAARRLGDIAAEEIAARVWPEVRTALGIPAAPLPPYRVVREKRATFEATAEQEALRPSTRSPLGNLALAGDWTSTGLPASIEGAIRSGRRAAGMLLRS